MKWPARQDGDTRIVKRFLWLPRAMPRRLAVDLLSKALQVRWFERATWKQKWRVSLSKAPSCWVDVSWEDLPVGRKLPMGKDS